MHRRRLDDPVDLKRLFNHLDRFCMRCLEAAAGLCVSRGHYEVTVEHVLLKMLGEPKSELALILACFEVDEARLARSLEQTVADLKTGCAGKPGLSPLLVEWIEDAWMIASIDLGLSSIRSGALALALVSRARRLLSGDHEELDKIRLEELERHLDAIVSGSNETEGATPPGTAPTETARRAGESALARFASDLPCCRASCWRAWRRAAGRPASRSPWTNERSPSPRRNRPARTASPRRPTAGHPAK